MVKLHSVTTTAPDTLAPAPAGELGRIVTWTLTAFLMVFAVVAGIWSVAVWDVRAYVIRWALLIALVAPAIVAGLLAFSASRMILNAVEELVGLDLNGDGAIGDDARRMIIINRAKRTTTEGVDDDDLRDFVRVICQTRDFTQATWRGRKMVSGRTCSNAYHRDIMAILIRAGVVVEDGKARRLAIDDLGVALRTLNL